MLIQCYFFAVFVSFVDGKVRIDPRGNDVLAEKEGEVIGKSMKFPPMLEDALTPSVPEGPHFSPDAPKFVAGAVGSPAYIPCKARNLGAKSVSI